MSTERDLLRDYAAEVAIVPGRTIKHGAFSGLAKVGDRFALAPKSFRALQNVLDILETCDGMELSRVGIEGLRDAIRKGPT